MGPAFLVFAKKQAKYKKNSLPFPIHENTMNNYTDE
jgi:hypothetical protein